MPAKAGRALFWLAVGAVLAIAVVQRVSLPTAPFTDPDSWGYLRPGFSKLQGGGFIHTHARPFPYPGFVYLVLLAFGSLDAVTVVQHALGLVAGMVVLAAWLGLARLLPVLPRLRLAHRLMGLPLLAGVLLVPNVVAWEHSIRPEGILPVLFAGLLFGLVRLVALTAGGGRPPARGVFLWGATVLVVTGLIYFVKSQFALAVPASVAVVCWVTCRARLGPLRSALVFAVPAVVVGALLWLPEKRLASEDRLAEGFLAKVLFFCHLDLAVDLLAEDSDDESLDDAERAFRRKLVEVFEESRERFLASGAETYSVLGFNADDLLYGEAGQTLRRHFSGPRAGQLASFCMDTFTRAVLSDPGAYLGKVFRQLRLVYDWDADIFEQRNWRMTIQQYYARSYDALAPYARHQDFGDVAWDYLSEVERRADQPTPAPLESNAVLQGFLASFHVLERSYLVLLLGAGVLAVALRPPVPPLVVAIVVNAWILGLNVTAAAIHTLEIRRYAHLHHVLWLFAIGVNVLLVLVMLSSPGKGGRPAK